jgi:hypothetical protein
MTDVLEHLIERVAKLRQAAQDETVRSVLEIESRHTGVYQLDDAERTDILTALAEVDRGEVASDADAQAVFERLTN